jgi:hypothetical protein
MSPAGITAGFKNSCGFRAPPPAVNRRGPEMVPSPPIGDTESVRVMSKGWPPRIAPAKIVSPPLPAAANRGVDDAR